MSIIYRRSSKPDSAACTRRGLRTCSQEQSQCRDASWIGGRRLSRCFGRVVKTLHWEGEPQDERLTTSTTASQSIAPTFNGTIQKTLLPTFCNELARQAQHPHGQSLLPYPLQQPNKQTQ